MLTNIRAKMMPDFFFVKKNTFYQLVSMCYCFFSYEEVIATFLFTHHFGALVRVMRKKRALH